MNFVNNQQIKQNKQDILILSLNKEEKTADIISNENINDEINIIPKIIQLGTSEDIITKIKECSIERSQEIRTIQRIIVQSNLTQI